MYKSIRSIRETRKFGGRSKENSRGIRQYIGSEERKSLRSWRSSSYSEDH